MADKICKICKQEKEETLEFYFHKPTGYYSNTCKLCHNEKIRLNRPIISGRREGSIFVKQKVCIKCSISKDINPENFTTAGRNYAKTCRECSDKEKDLKIQSKLNKGPLPDDYLKFCNICKTDKNIPHFSYSKKYKVYSYCCKSCDTNRKREKFLTLSEEEKEQIREKGRSYHKLNKPKSLKVAYNTFDFKKNLENDLTKEYIENQLSKSCIYCGYPSTGLDRKDNKLGHLQSNCVSCCWECNTARNNNFSHEEMLMIGKSIKEVKDKRNSI